MNSYLALDAATVKAEIGRLIEAYPELADDESLRLDMIEGETDLHKIVGRALSERAEAEMMVTAIKERAADLQARRSRFERKGEAMRALIKSLMETAGLDKLPLPEATISLRDPVPSVDVLDLEAIPQGYYRMKKEADKTAIKKALMDGAEIPGAVLALGESSLTIRTK